MAGPDIKVWDPLVRLFHWSLVASFAIAWLTADDWRDLHEWAGYAAGALIAFRLLWGFAGPRYARFSQFVRSPGTIARYLGSMLRGGEVRYVGHNPAGGAMIIALILCMGGTALTGWMYTRDAFWGVDWVLATHETLANTMLALVALHVLGVVVASLRHRENLARAMVVGRKRAPGIGDVA
ncbi:cytochrome b/b6 domain-containing protein [Acuticoccus kandeliae]|uniref:cytochrome b/b6 domain-containing protein n=1 Tax=Acuticoccus kandeliae TaxID=2073160 RepID=UPI000D3E904C|nr:cytochrome b/b6 domain-containing protein [Acuticoccus kandeliae]